MGTPKEVNAIVVEALSDENFRSKLLGPTREATIRDRDLTDKERDAMLKAPDDIRGFIFAVEPLTNSDLF